MNIEDARKLLTSGNVFYDFEEDDEDYEQFKQAINLNDVFGWGWADCEMVKDNELPELARLYDLYGWCGVLYWVSQKRDGMRSEFLDNNRFIDFVAAEEQLIKEEPDFNKRAYKKYSYTLGMGER